MTTTLFAHPGREAFEHSLIVEHLSEAGFLIAQRAHCHAAHGRTWTDAARLEVRAARHLGALAAQNAPAVQAARVGIDADDEDLCVGSIATLAACGDVTTDMPALITRVLAATPSQADFWHSALAWTAYSSVAFSEALMAAIPVAPLDRRTVLAELIITRSAAGTDALLSWLKGNASSLAVETRDAVALAFGRMGHGAARDTLAHFWDASPSPTLREALLLLGHFRALPRLRRELRHAAQPAARDLLLLALAGEARDARLLQHAFEHGDEATRVASVQAMGWLGVTESMATLVTATTQGEPLASTARTALERLAALTPTDEPVAWWSTNQSRLVPETRYRQGEPYRALHSLRELEAIATPSPLRHTLAIELRLRSGLMLAFDPSFAVGRQQQALNAWRQAVTR